MRALVTGGAGFIGSHLCWHLVSTGWHVDIVDSLQTGSYDNIKGLPNSEFYNGVVSRNSKWQHQMAREADIIFHLAATVGVDLVQRQPVEAVESNIRATQDIIDLARQYKKPILIASSSEVYGRRNDDQPLHEDMDLHIGTELRWGYAAAKLADEFTALAHHKESGLPVVIARLFNTVGPRQVGTYGMVMPRMIDAAIAGRPIQIIGGAQRRSFAWVTEVVDCLVRLIHAPAAHGQVVNVGSENQISIQALASKIQREAAKFKIHQPASEYLPYRTDWADIMFRKPDLAKLKFLIGFTPTMPIADMIQALVADKMSGLTPTVR